VPSVIIGHLLLHKNRTTCLVIMGVDQEWVASRILKIAMHACHTKLCNNACLRLVVYACHTKLCNSRWGMQWLVVGSKIHLELEVFNVCFQSLTQRIDGCWNVGIHIEGDAWWSKLGIPCNILQLDACHMKFCNNHRRLRFVYNMLWLVSIVCMLQWVVQPMNACDTLWLP